MFLFIVTCFIALELYATHWILLPYYTGLIAHVPSGALQSFHPGRVTIGLAEVLQRLQANRPWFFTNSVILSAWLLFVTGTLVLFCIAFRCIRQSSATDSTSAQKLQDEGNRDAHSAHDRTPIADSRIYGDTINHVVIKLMEDLQICKSLKSLLGGVSGGVMTVR